MAAREAGMITKAPLPEFSRPPVAEVALAVRFQALAGLRAVQLGRLWELWREGYPRLEEQPPLPSAGEQQPGFAVTFGPPPVSRHWFQSAHGDRVIQLQADRLIVNWRQTPGQEYPRYSVLREELARRLEDVAGFSRQGGWGDLSPVEVELTYVNLIEAADGGAARASDVLTSVSGDERSLGEELETSIVRRFRDASSPAPVLVVSAGPGLDVRGAPVLVLSLVVRAPVGAGGGEVVLDTMDAAHVRLVQGFSALTRPTMHQAWGRTK